MMADTAKERSNNIKEAFAVRSDTLKHLRSVMQMYKDLNGIVGVAARFAIVIDSNIILGEIIWLVSKRKNPLAKTDLMEVIEAETVDAYVPPKLVKEVEEKIPLIADEKGLDNEQMLVEWEEYKNRLKIVSPDSQDYYNILNDVDPDDVDFIALARTIAAPGVLTKDKHIGMMGGNAISIECITHLRNYSRTTAIELNIKINGITVGMIGIRSFQALVEGCQALVKSIASAPWWVKALLIIALVCVIASPQARAKIEDFLRGSLEFMKERVPPLFDFINQISVIANDNKAQAQLHLEKALEDLERQIVGVAESKTI